jgi:hypothetical protein
LNGGSTLAQGNDLEAENANVNVSTYESIGSFGNNLLSKMGRNLKIPNNHLNQQDLGVVLPWLLGGQ